MYLNFDVVASINGFPFVYTPQPGDAAQTAAYGGTAGDPYDDRINSPGDVIERINLNVLDDMSDAAAHGIFWYAFRTPAQDGAKGPLNGSVEFTMVPVR